MSHTFSKLYARHIVAVLQNRRFPAPARLVLRGFPGLPLRDVFQALLELCGDYRTPVELPDVDSPAFLAAFPIGTTPGGIELIPYLVDEAPGLGHATWNRGSRGFAGRLRDYYTRGAKGTRLLLTLDERPIETQSTSSDLELAELLETPERVTASIVEATVPSRPLLNAIGQWYASAVRPIRAAEIEVLHGFLTEFYGADDLTVAENLHRLGVLMPDPGLSALKGARAAARLDKNYTLVADTEASTRKADPPFPVACQRLFKPDVAKQVAGAWDGQRLDWGQLVFLRVAGARMRSRTTDSATVSATVSGDEAAGFAEVPFIVSGASQAIYRRRSAADGGPDEVDMVIHLIPPLSKSAVTVQFSREVLGEETVHLMTWREPRRRRRLKGLRGWTGTSAAFELDLAKLGGTDPWRFLEIAITPGTRYSAKSASAICRIAFYVSKSDELVFEDHRLVNPAEHAFTVPGEPLAVVLRPEEEPETSPLSLGFSDLDSERIVKEVPGLGGVMLPLYLEAVEGDEDAQSQANRADSPEHALLKVRAEWEKTGAPEADDYALARSGLRFYLDTTGLHASADGAGDLVLRTTPAGQAEWEPHHYLAWENQIIQHPEHIRFSLRDGRLTPDVKSSDLLDSLPGDVAELARRFFEARTTFFKYLQAKAGIGQHREDQDAGFAAVQCGYLAVSKEAANYVNSYLELADGLPVRYASVFDHITYCDFIRTGDGHYLAAPTHPLTIAYYRSLQRFVSKYWAKLTAELWEQNLDHTLIPHVKLDEKACQATNPPAFLWHRFVPLAEAEATDKVGARARFVTRVLKRFLTVHRQYAGPRKTVVLAALNPGDGRYLLEGIKSFLSNPPGALGDPPRFEVHLISADDCGQGFEEYFRMAGPEDALYRHVRFTIKGGLSGALVDLPEYLPFVHITFVDQWAARQLTMGDLERDRVPTSVFAQGMSVRMVGTHEADGPYHRFWSSVWPGSDRFPAADDAEAELRRGIALTGALVAASHTLRYEKNRMPAAFLKAAHGLMGQAYDRSVWVVHFDRMLGLEAFFDQKDSDTLYLLDQDRALRSITGTKRKEFFVASMEATAESLGLVGAPLSAILRQLNAVSSRWVMDLHDRKQAKVGLGLGALLRWVLSTNHLKPAIREDELVLLAPAGMLLENGEEQVKEAVSAAAWNTLVAIRVHSDSVEAETSALAVNMWPVMVELQEGPAADLVAFRSVIKDLRTHFECGGVGRLFAGATLALVLEMQARRLAAHAMLGYGEPEQSHFRRVYDALVRGQFTLAVGMAGQATPRCDGDVLVFNYGVAGTAQELLPVQDVESIVGRLGLYKEGVAELLNESRCSVALPRTWPDLLAPGADADGQPVLKAKTVGVSAHGVGLEGRLAVPQTELANLADRLTRVFRGYGLQVAAFDPGLVQTGPAILRFRTRTLPGEKLDRIEAREDDFARELGAKSGVLVTQDPPYICVDLPRPERVDLLLPDVWSALPAPVPPGQLPVMLGVTPGGDVRWTDLARMPHMLVAGATGSGKSVFLTTTICSLITRLPPSRLQLVIIDPKGLDFQPFEEIPHLKFGGVIIDPKAGIEMLLHTLEQEMVKRRQILIGYDATSVEELLRQEEAPVLPQMVVIVDEFADIMAQLQPKDREEFERAIQRYTQVARSFGIHLILATQRPSADVLIGPIKANVPVRVSFQLPSHHDSRTVLGMAGAEKLQGRGDMLFLAGGAPERIQAVNTPRKLVREILTNNLVK